MMSTELIQAIDSAVLHTANVHTELKQNNVYGIYISGLIYGMYILELSKYNNLSYTVDDLFDMFNSKLQSLLN